MPLKCPKCQSNVIKKNGTIHNGKQKYECLSCHRQFVENPENKVVSDDTKERIRRALLERVSLEGLCRIFDVSLPWLLQFMEKIYEELPDDLNATVHSHNEDLTVITTQIDEMWSYVGNKQNQQWLWMVIDVKSRQILAFHIGDRSKSSGEILMKKLPEELKKKPFFTQTISQFTSKSFQKNNIDQLEKDQGKQITLKDLTARLGKDAQD